MLIEVDYKNKQVRVLKIGKRVTKPKSMNPMHIVSIDASWPTEVRMFLMMAGLSGAEITHCIDFIHDIVRKL